MSALPPRLAWPACDWQSQASSKDRAELDFHRTCTMEGARTMRLVFSPVALAVFFVLTASVSLSRAADDDVTKCKDVTGGETTISACTYAAKGDYGGAVADYTEAIRLDPKSSRLYFNRGIANLYSGALPKALADLNQATALDPKNAYAALWLDIAGQRSHVPSRLAQEVSAIDMTAWPAPVVRMFLGQMTPDAVMAAAEDPDATKKKGQVCEANFYSGELALQRDARGEATRLFKLAADGCPKTFTEYRAAVAELKALDQGYGGDNKDCLAWTDGCINCSRPEPGAQFSCSNIGTACQPKQVVCEHHSNP
jgi:hypothetical protein